jgi:hypothetical protein
LFKQDDDELYHLDPAVVEDAKRQAELDTMESGAQTKVVDASPDRHVGNKDAESGAEHVETTV